MSSRPESIFTPIAILYQAKPDGRSQALARTYAELAALDIDAPRVKGHAVSWACGVLADSYSADGPDGFGFDPVGCVPTFQMLMAPQVAMLAARLMCQPGMPSKEWEPGARVASAGALPEWMESEPT